MQYCPACANEVVPNSGHPQSDYLLIEEFPELVYPPAPANGWQKREDWTPSKIVANELAKVGMLPQQFHIITVYPHHVPSDGQPSENCYSVGLEQAISIIGQYKGVIVLGANLCKTFTGYPIDQVQGLSDVPSQYIPDGDIVRMFLPNIRSIYATGAGEFSIGLKRFADKVRV